jgi:hypothetical protein
MATDSRSTNSLDSDSYGDSNPGEVTSEEFNYFLNGNVAEADAASDQHAADSQPGRDDNTQNQPAPPVPETDEIDRRILTELALAVAAAPSEDPRAARMASAGSEERAVRRTEVAVEQAQGTVTKSKRRGRPTKARAGNSEEHGAEDNVKTKQTEKEKERGEFGTDEEVEDDNNTNDGDDEEQAEETEEVNEKGKKEDRKRTKRACNACRVSCLRPLVIRGLIAAPI